MGISGSSIVIIVSCASCTALQIAFCIKKMQASDQNKKKKKHTMLKRRKKTTNSLLVSPESKLSSPPSPVEIV